MTHTTETFILKAREVHGDSYEYSDTSYKKWNHKVDITCSLHGNFSQSAHTHLKGSGCQKCAIEKMFKTHDIYCKEIEDSTNNKIIVVDKYIQDSCKIRHKCTICDNVWLALPSSVRRGHGCPLCGQIKSHKKQTKTHKQYLVEVAEVNANIQVIGNYNGARLKIKHKCNICDRVWEAIPTNILRGKGCPSCRTSTGEKAIAAFLNAQNIEFESQKEFDGCGIERNFRFDFYLPKYNLIIEYDGEQHFGPIDFFGSDEGFIRQMIRDEAKDHFCEVNKIRLARIAYSDKDKIPDIINYNIEYILDENWNFDF